MRSVLGTILVGLWMLATGLPSVAADPVSSPTQRIDQLIQQLGDDDFFRRERAQEELSQMGEEAFDALSAALSHDDIEIAARARYLVRLIRVQWSRAGDPEEVADLLKDYDEQDEAGRATVAQSLSELPPMVSWPVLCRIVRFERSELLSKQAALKVLAQLPKLESDRASVVQSVQTALGRSPTAGAAWIRLGLALQEQPQKMDVDWSPAIAAELVVHQRTPQLTSPEIVITLLKLQVALCQQRDRTEDVQAALLKIVELEPGTLKTLPEQIDWLVGHQAFKAIDVLVARFADAFEQQPLLQYTLATVRTAQGRLDLAAEAEQKALAMNPGDQNAHWQTARELHRRGQHKFAQQEYRQVITIGPPASLYTFFSQTGLAEMLHDEEQHGGAAEVLAAAVQELEQNEEFRDLVEKRLERPLSALKSRMLYFRARQAGLDGEAVRQVEFLDQAIATDPFDADVLIALYRLPDPSPERRKQTLALIQKTAEHFREQIQDAPEDATPYNQLAWLVGNTEGDQREALAASLKSLELSPNAAGYLDTLGRCYYAQGDLANAVKSQTRAVELEPHSAQMKRQLKLFQEALARQSPSPENR